jgi:hypothetical protein
MLEDVEVVEHHLDLLQHRPDRIEIRSMHIGTDGGDRRPLVSLRSSDSSGVALVSLRSFRKPITSPCTMWKSTVQNCWPLPR